MLSSSSCEKNSEKLAPPPMYRGTALAWDTSLPTVALRRRDSVRHSWGKGCSFPDGHHVGAYTTYILFFPFPSYWARSTTVDQLLNRALHPACFTVLFDLEQSCRKGSYQRLYTTVRKNVRDDITKYIHRESERIDTKFSAEFFSRYCHHRHRTTMQRLRVQCNADRASILDTHRIALRALTHCDRGFPP